MAKGLASPTRQPIRAFAVHTGRVLVFVAIILLLRVHHGQVRARFRINPFEADLHLIQAAIPGADRISERQAARGGRVVLGEAGESLGFVVQTAPESDDVVGFSGSTNVLIGFDRDARVSGMSIVQSEDTREHLRDVQNDSGFLQSLNGCTWEEALRIAPQVDAVSGATLTSLAILEGVMRRLERTSNLSPSSRTPLAVRSLKFPEPISLKEGVAEFPETHVLRSRPQESAIFDALDVNGKKLGSLFRTSPSTDQTIGYQGPTDTLVVLDAQDRVLRLRIRKSYDNEPYVGYVRDEIYFLRDVWVGTPLIDLPALDLEEAEIEGVSGATMTSQAVAASVPRAAAFVLRDDADATRVGTIADPSRSGDKEPARQTRGISFSIRDVGTFLVLATAALIAFTPLRGRRRIRIGFQCVLIGYLGLLNGDLLSQAQLVGWAKSGTPWRIAPGLTLLTLAALMTPVFSKRNLYCQHICPFGAAQQWVRPRKARSNWRWIRRLRLLPLALVCVAVATGFFHWPLELAALEPFDAFLLGNVVSIAIAIVALAAATQQPMAYCRFGCPTGAVLEFLRFRRGADRLEWGDGAAFVLLIMGAFICWMA